MMSRSDRKHTGGVRCGVSGHTGRVLGVVDLNMDCGAAGCACAKSVYLADKGAVPGAPPVVGGAPVDACTAGTAGADKVANTDGAGSNAAWSGRALNCGEFCTLPCRLLLALVLALADEFDVALVCRFTGTANTLDVRSVGAEGGDDAVT